MKLKSFIVRGLVAVLLLGLVVWVFFGSEKDPIFKGKRLSRHLEDCRVNGIALGGRTTGMMLEEPIQPYLDGLRVSETAREAILAEGTNALPMLLRMLTWGETRADVWRRFLVEKCGLPQKLLKTNWVARWQNQTRALAAFHTLGSNAAPATRSIVRLLNDPENAYRAIVALTLIRPNREDYILSLTNVARLQKPTRTGAPPGFLLSGALLALGSFGPKASNAIPFLINSLSSTNERVQAAAAVALARVGAPAEKVVPLIIKTLPKSDPTPPPGAMTGLTGALSETLMKLWALEQYGPKARDALPMLSIIEKYRTRNFQEAAKKASARIKGEPYVPREWPQ